MFVLALHIASLEHEVPSNAHYFFVQYNLFVSVSHAFRLQIQVLQLGNQWVSNFPSQIIPPLHSVSALILHYSLLYRRFLGDLEQSTVCHATQRNHGPAKLRGRV